MQPTIRQREMWICDQVRCCHQEGDLQSKCAGEAAVRCGNNVCLVVGALHIGILSVRCCCNRRRKSLVVGSGVVCFNILLFQCARETNNTRLDTISRARNTMAFCFVDYVLFPDHNGANSSCLVQVEQRTHFTSKSILFLLIFVCAISPHCSITTDEW